MYLANFGLAKVITESGATTSSTLVGGTPGFQATEQLKGGKVSAKCDVYALGDVLTELFGQQPLWPKMSAYRIMVCVTVEGGFPETNHLLESIQKLTALCFTTPEKRTSASDLYTFNAIEYALSHVMISVAIFLACPKTSLFSDKYYF